jgi:hypothetical protein
MGAQPLSASGRPATIIVAPELVDVETRHRAERHDAEADLVAHHDDLAARLAERGEKGTERFVRGGGRCAAVGGAQQVREPQREAVDQHAMALAIHRAQRAREVERCFEKRPADRAPRPVVRHAFGEFGVADARGRDIGDGHAACGGELLGVRALARARAAENEGEVPR